MITCFKLCCYMNFLLPILQRSEVFFSTWNFSVQSTVMAYIQILPRVQKMPPVLLRYREVVWYSSSSVLISWSRNCLTFMSGWQGLQQLGTCEHINNYHSIESSIHVDILLENQSNVQKVDLNMCASLTSCIIGIVLLLVLIWCIVVSK